MNCRHGFTYVDDDLREAIAEAGSICGFSELAREYCLSFGLVDSFAVARMMRDIARGTKRRVQYRTLERLSLIVGIEVAA